MEARRHDGRRGLRRRRLILIPVGLLAVLLLTVLWPEPPPEVPSRARPAASYEEAVRRIAAIETAEGPEVAPEGRTSLLSYGLRTPRAFLLLHGLANCPRQFAALAERLHASGANVYVPRLPHHGLADRMTEDLRHLTAEELIRFTEAQVDIACGLGDTLIVAGLSLGALQAAWAFQSRAEVHRAVLVSPMFGLALVPRPLLAPLMRFWLRTPNQFLWWDPRAREALPGPRHVYPRYSTHALAQSLRQARALMEEIRERAPSGRSVVAVTTASDLAVDNAATAGVVRDWRRRIGDRALRYEFPRHLGIGHDMVDPEQPYQRVELVYPVLERFLLAP